MIKNETNEEITIDDLLNLTLKEALQHSNKTTYDIYNEFINIYKDKKNTSFFEAKTLFNKYEKYVNPY